MRSDLATLQIQASKESQNSTNGNWKSSTNLSISELEQIKDRIDTLESIADIHGSDLSHLETDMNVLEHRIEQATENLTSQDVIITAINESIMQLKVLTNDLSNSSETGGTTLSQLEADMNSFEAIIQELSSRIIEFEANITAGRAFKLRLMTVIAKMETNLTSENAEILLSLADLDEKIENRLLQIELDIGTNRANVDNNADKIKIIEANISYEMGMSEYLSSNLTDLEIEMGTFKTTIQSNHDRINENSDKIELLNENITAYCDIAHNLSSNIVNLKSQIGTTNAAIQNNDAGINDNSDKIRLLNETITAKLGNTQNFESTITDLERDIATVKAAIQNNYNEIASSFADIEELNKSTSNSISQLVTRLSDTTGNYLILKVADKCSSDCDILMNILTHL